MPGEEQQFDPLFDRDGTAASDETIEFERPAELDTGELPPLGRERTPPSTKRFKPIGFTLKLGVFALAFYFFVLPLGPDFRDAWRRIQDVEPIYLIGGFGLQIAAWFCYSLLTRSALGDAAGGVSRMRFFRIQMSTSALSKLVPGGNATASALGYRLLTLSGISGPDAGFALATAGLGSAIVLNLLFWVALMVSIPIRGVNPGYAAAALAGVVLMLLAAGLVVGVMHGQGRADRIIRWICAKLRLNPESAIAVVRQIGQRVEELLSDRELLIRVVFWAALNWLLDAASLWVFLRAFGGSLDVDALIVAFCLANVLAAIPLTPGGLGIVEASYLSTLPAFGVPWWRARLGLASYRIAQLILPIILGAILYASLRVGPWKIERRDRLSRLRDIAKRADPESRVDFALRQWERTRRGEAPVPDPAFDGAVPPPFEEIVEDVVDEPFTAADSSWEPVAEQDAVMFEAEAEMYVDRPDVPDGPGVDQGRPHDEQ